MNSDWGFVIEAITVNVHHDYCHHITLLKVPHFDHHLLCASCTVTVKQTFYGDTVNCWDTTATTMVSWWRQNQKNNKHCFETKSNGHAPGSCISEQTQWLFRPWWEPLEQHMQTHAVGWPQLDQLLSSTHHLLDWCISPTEALLANQQCWLCNIHMEEPVGEMHPCACAQVSSAVTIIAKTAVPICGVQMVTMDYKLVPNVSWILPLAYQHQQQPILSEQDKILDFFYHCHAGSLEWETTSAFSSLCIGMSPAFFPTILFKLVAPR